MTMEIANTYIIGWYLLCMPQHCTHRQLPFGRGLVVVLRRLRHTDGRKGSRSILWLFFQGCFGRDASASTASAATCHDARTRSATPMHTHRSGKMTKPSQNPNSMAGVKAAGESGDDTCTQLGALTQGEPAQAWAP